MAATKEAPNLLTYQYNKATSTGLNRQRGSKDSSGLLAALLSQIIPPQQHPVTIAIIETLKRRKKACQRSSHYLSAIYRSQRERGGGHRHKDMRRSSLKSIYKAQVSPLLNPSGPSHPAIIPIFPYLCSQNDPISNLRICLPASLPAFLVIHLWRINYCVPNFEYILQLSDEVKK